jgi:sugar phosphate permease
MVDVEHSQRDAADVETFAQQRWLRLMPPIFIAYSLAFADRVNYAFGSAGGLADDLKISDSTASLLAATFFLGYVAFQVPAAEYAKKRSARKLIFWGLVGWGLLAASTGLVQTVWQLFIIRFALGAVESVVLPALLVFIAQWFMRKERSRANTLLILGNPITLTWMSIVSGYLVGWLGWRGMFIAEGIPSVLFAFVWWYLVRDKPDDVGWMDEGEKSWLNRQLESEQDGLAPVKNYAEAFRTPAVILLCLVYFFWSLGVYGFVLWLPSIVQDASDSGIGAVGLLTALPYIAAAIFMVANSWASDRTLERSRFVWPYLLVGAAAFWVSYAIGDGNFLLSLAMLILAAACMYAPYGPFFAHIPDILPANVAGGSMALINSMGAVGSFTGTYLVGWLRGSTGSDGPGFLVMGAALVVAAGCWLVSVSVAGDRMQRPDSSAAAHI